MRILALVAAMIVVVVAVGCEHLTDLAPYPEETSVTIRVMVIDTGIAPLPQIKPFLSKRNVPYDLEDVHGHGTHITGIILYGPTLKDKVCPQVRIYSCNFYKGDHQFTTTDCFKRAQRVKAKFANFSGGGIEHVPEEDEAIREFDGTVIAAVGNADPIALDLFKTPFYPASLKHPNIIAVGNGKSWKKKSPSTNYGRPGMKWRNGKDIVSFGRSGGLVTMNGSSQAAAIMTHELIQRECQRLRSVK